MKRQEKRNNIVSIAAYLILFLFAIFSLQCSGDLKSKKGNSKLGHFLIADSSVYPKFEFTKEIHKFGEISEGEIGVCEFYFKNIGGRDLIISNIESSCGCTNVDWEKNPIKSGAESKITIEFDSEGRSGRQYKVITLYANTLKREKKLYITAQIK
ncbi:DUF1573 domain-containing protein [Marinifilum sp. RC60d5]|uniref:DUF1573 domain-containing protein n=1 Tax=Marinifilum sp. RC60d5 TaxID=3458414 RepID=UPI00403627AD